MTYTGKYVKYNNDVIPELNFHEVEYTQLFSKFFKIIHENKSKNIIEETIEIEFFDYIYKAVIINGEPVIIKVRR